MPSNESSLSSSEFELFKDLIPAIEKKTEKPWKSSPGERYGLRRINESDTNETQVYTDMDRHPNVLKFMDPPEPSRPEEIDWLVRSNGSDSTDPRLLWAIVNDENKMVGWVMFYETLKANPEEGEHLMDELRKQFDFPPDALILDTSYSKNIQWPEDQREEDETGEPFIKSRDKPDTEEYKGVAINGLKQGMLLVKEMELMAEQMGMPSRRVFITAFTVPENEASEVVLTKNDFTKLPKMIDYSGEMNNAWVKEI